MANEFKGIWDSECGIRILPHSQFRNPNSRLQFEPESLDLQTPYALRT